MKTRLLASGLFISFLVVFGCSNPPKPEPVVEEEPAPVVEEKPTINQDSIDAARAREDSLRRARLEAERLEQQRQRLQNMMNKLMSEEVYFDYDKSALTAQARDILTEAASLLNSEPRLYVEVQGHTDTRGTESYNMTLGSKRAQAVVEYLVNQAVDASRLKSVSFGEEQPKVEGNTEDAHSQNRRAAFSVRIQE